MLIKAKQPDHYADQKGQPEPDREMEKPPLTRLVHNAPVPALVGKQHVEVSDRKL